ncbi:MAG: hypothetical protein GXY42_02845, partial [Desulfovibrionales bacterium]|nr:hypothetical protein [Desulfovibrionales bacterium]
SILVWITIFLISCVQFYFPRYWGEIHVRGSDLAYNFSMLTVALVLINSLVKLSGAQERKLLNRVIEQESVLQRAKELQFRVFDWLDAGLMVVDQQGIITTINQTALVWTSESHRSKIIGRSFVHFFPEFSPFWEDRGQISLRRNTVTSQKRNVIFGFKITQLPAQQGWLILFSDITDVQRLENQVKEMEKLASVGELAAGLAHEMKNPLAGIKASLQLLLSGDMDQEVSDRLARVIVRDIDRLDFLLKDFLIFARPREARPEPLDLGQEIEHVLMSFRLQHPMVRVQVDVGPEPYLFDRDHLHQILINLLGNALQALQGREKPVISIADMRDSGQRKVVVDDNGPGLDPTVRGRCFDPFVTTKALGSGLGLAIARRLAVQNGAFLELLDGPDGGVRAVLTQEQPSGRKGTETQDSP